MKSKDVRRKFLEFYADKGHTPVRSSPLVLAGDPTLMFANAGMNQFKDVFTGQEARSYKRATSSQKCVRAGGKHNDLENVGFTARHHTFFEMLGNFSFGDYFKQDAITWAYNLLVKEFGFDPKRLCYTVYGGDPSLPGIGPDDEARKLWSDIAGVGDDRIFGLGAKDNFWQMGDTGPMGPCTELHYYQGAKVPDKLTKEQFLVDSDAGVWMEVWNLVFMQFERKVVGGPLATLPAPSVDTGAGLERMTAVLGEKATNYDTDLFQPLIQATAELSRKRYGADAMDDASMKVIADHARATAFLVADGVFPDKNGREYVLRRIFRRAVRHGKRLGIEDPFMHKITGVVVREMGDVFPELVERKAIIEQIALEEETNFRRTLDRGLRLLEDEFDGMKKSGSERVSGARVFQLYDTFGFPKDLTQVIAQERGYSIDDDGFEAEMATARSRSEFKGQEKAVEGVYKELAQKLGKTRFQGYDAETAQGKVLALVGDGGKSVTIAKMGQSVALVADTTPFYGESGGQTGDLGTLVGPSGTIAVEETVKPAGDMIVHIGRVIQGQVAVGETITATIDGARRAAIRANHSATHLLHLALKRVLGEHAAQKGSLVAPDRLRFDFSHFSAVTPAERQKIEDLVNTTVLENHDSVIEVLSQEDAKKKGAVAMFGEKYGDKVRVVQIGADSLEFCGGTHVRRAGDIGQFKIISEAGVAQGVRRIEAVTGQGALAYVRKLEEELANAGAVLRANPLEVADRVNKLAAELKARDKEVGQLKAKLAEGGGRDLLDDVKTIHGVKVLAARTDLADAKALRDVGDKLRDKLGSGVVVLLGVADDKVAILTMVTKDLVAKVHAGKLASELATLTGGKGGGRPDMAQAGGNDASRVPAALARALEFVEQSLA